MAESFRFDFFRSIPLRPSDSHCCSSIRLARPLCKLNKADAPAWSRLVGWQTFTSVTLMDEPLRLPVMQFARAGQDLAAHPIDCWCSFDSSESRLFVLTDQSTAHTDS